MPHIIYTSAASADLVRLAKFLAQKDRGIARRAIATIKGAIEQSAIFPDRFRPVPDLMHYREIVIDFGSTGYIVRFRHEHGGDIHIVRIRHQLENDFPEN